MNEPDDERVGSRAGSGIWSGRVRRLGRGRGRIDLHLHTGGVMVVVGLSR